MSRALNGKLFPRLISAPLSRRGNNKAQPSRHQDVATSVGLCIRFSPYPREASGCRSRDSSACRAAAVLLPAGDRKNGWREPAHRGYVLDCHELRLCAAYGAQVRREFVHPRKAPLVDADVVGWLLAVSILQGKSPKGDAAASTYTCNVGMVRTPQGTQVLRRSIAASSCYTTGGRQSPHAAMHTHTHRCIARIQAWTLRRLGVTRTRRSGACCICPANQEGAGSVNYVG